MKIPAATIFVFVILLMGCRTENSTTREQNPATLTEHLKPFNEELPTIGLLMYNGVLQGEIIAPSDVFSKPSEDGKQLFNVVSISETDQPVVTVIICFVSLEFRRIVCAPSYTLD